MAGPEPSESVDGVAGLSLARALATAGSLGVIVAVAAGVGEWAAAHFLSPGRDLLGPMPWDLAAGALGERVITHAMLWCTLLLGVALLHHVATRGRLAPLPVLAGSAVAGVGLIALPAAIYMSGLRDPLLGWAVRVAAILLALASGLLLRARPVSERWLHVAAGPALLVALVSGSFFALSSPWLDPADYRVPEALGPAPDATPERPHVLLVVLDTVRADRMSVYGWRRPTTPFLEDWAQGSILYERAIADGTWTIPSHASLFTGRAVRAHGAGLAVPGLDGRLPTLAETLAAAGYRTAAFSNNSLVSRRTGLSRGFALAHVLSGLRAWSRFSIEGLLEGRGLPPPLPWLDQDDGAAVTNLLIARWLDAREGSAPLFVFVNYLEAHLPWRVPAAFRREFMDDDQLRRSYALRRKVHGELVGLMNRTVIERGADVIEPGDAEVLKRQYDAAIRYLDHRLAELLELFAQRGLLDDTLVVITSDHGEYLGTHGMWSHLLGAFNDLTHVPLLIREPGRRQGARIAEPVQLSDVHATILAAALRRPSEAGVFASRDLLALLPGEGGPGIAISEVGELGAAGALRDQRERATPEIARLAAPTLTAQDGRFKYVESESERPRLYDLARDPGELHDVSRYHPEDVARLARHLGAWRDGVSPHEPAGEGAIPDGARELLRELGYLRD